MTKLGIFPFKPDVVKATLAPVQLKPVQRVYTGLNPRFDQIAETVTSLEYLNRRESFCCLAFAFQNAPAKPRVPNRRGSFPHESVIMDQKNFDSRVGKADNRKASKALTRKDVQASSSQVVQNCYQFPSVKYLNEAKKTSNEVEGLGFCLI
ncbi:hypothetical protein BV898_18435 [Hypsibius exemplaris]|uniref:Uncharacterized protein n=1 Tax=Hypsibius exemplaris TaxID=2072580 RepID=A0A9X6NH75_HYPEX|nr:hypothetical protein BV898_18435 [Hypsibius exemplaris]